MGLLYIITPSGQSVPTDSLFDYREIYFLLWKAKVRWNWESFLVLGESSSHFSLWVDYNESVRRLITQGNFDNAIPNVIGTWYFKL